LTAIDPHAPLPSSAGQSYAAQHGTGPVNIPSLVQPVGCRRVMSTGIGITLVAVGVILRLAVPATFTYGLKVHVVAVIVILAGVFGLLMSLLVWGPLSRRRHRSGGYVRGAPLSRQRTIYRDQSPSRGPSPL
jgi:hypothetical protein